MMDTNNDGKVSYAEFCQEIEASANARALTDKNHWAYTIFLQLRKTISASGRTLQDCF